MLTMLKKRDDLELIERSGDWRWSTNNVNEMKASFTEKERVANLLGEWVRQRVSTFSL